MHAYHSMLPTQAERRKYKKQNSSKISLPDINDLQGISFHTFYLPSVVAVSFSSTLRDSSTSMSVRVHTHTRERKRQSVLCFFHHISKSSKETAKIPPMSACCLHIFVFETII